MCRDIVIHCKWDDENAEEDAGEVFDEAKGYDSLVVEFENALEQFVEDHFFGSVLIEVRPLS